MIDECPGIDRSDGLGVDALRRCSDETYLDTPDRPAALRAERQQSPTRAGGLADYRRPAWSLPQRFRLATSCDSEASRSSIARRDHRWQDDKQYRYRRCG